MINFEKRVKEDGTVVTHCGCQTSPWGHEFKCPDCLIQETRPRWWIDEMIHSGEMVGHHIFHHRLGVDVLTREPLSEASKRWDDEWIERYARIAWHFARRLSAPQVDSELVKVCVMRSGYLHGGDTTEEGLADEPQSL